MATLTRVGDVADVVESPIAAWRGQRPAPALQATIEHGGVVACPSLAFDVSPDERALFGASLADDRRKSIYLRAGRAGLTGTTAEGAARDAVAAMIERFADASHALVDGLFPHLARRRARDRHELPAARDRRHVVGPRAVVAQGRHASARRRVPVESRRTANASCASSRTSIRTRCRAAGASASAFESMARRFLPRTRALPAGAAWLMHRVGITKRPRSAYDHLMLQLHDLAKADLDYQRTCPQRAIDFAPGTTWICFSDQVMHAAMSGQFMFEQTYRLPLDALADVGGVAVAHARTTDGSPRWSERTTRVGDRPA